MYYLAGYFVGSLLVAFLIIHLVFLVIGKKMHPDNRKTLEVLLTIVVAIVMTCKEYMGM